MKIKNLNKTLTLRVSQDEYERLRQWCSEREIRYSQVLRQFIRAIIEHSE